MQDTCFSSVSRCHDDGDDFWAVGVLWIYFAEAYDIPGQICQPSQRPVFVDQTILQIATDFWCKLRYAYIGVERSDRFALIVEELLDTILAEDLSDVCICKEIAILRSRWRCHLNPRSAHTVQLKLYELANRNRHAAIFATRSTAYIRQF